MPIQTLLPYDINERNSNKQAGFSVSEALEGLVQRKLQKVQQQNNAQLYQEAWKLDPRQAEFVSKQSEEFQQEFTKALRAEQQARAFDKEINPGKYTSQPPSLQEAMGALGGNDQRGQPTSIPETSLSGMGPQQTMQNPQRSIADVLGNQPLNPHFQAEAAKIKEKRRATDVAERTQAYKVNQKKIDALHDSAAQSKKDIEEFKKIKRYNATGKLVQGPGRDLLEKFGLENIFTNEPTEITSKLISGLSTGVVEAFGFTPRSQLFLQKYEQTLPRMINSKAGVDAICDEKIIERETDPIINDELRKLEHQYSKNREPYPLDILELAREKAQPRLNKLLEESNKNIDKFIERDNADIIKQLPPAHRSKDIPRINSERGIVAVSDGKKWTIRVATPEELEKDQNNE